MHTVNPDPFCSMTSQSPQEHTESERKEIEVNVCITDVRTRRAEIFLSHRFVAGADSPHDVHAHTARHSCRLGPTTWAKFCCGKKWNSAFQWQVRRTHGQPARALDLDLQISSVRSLSRRARRRPREYGRRRDAS
jgi:hypothetical protein